jgi:hypothetical protein
MTGLFMLMVMPALYVGDQSVDAESRSLGSDPDLRFPGFPRSGADGRAALLAASLRGVD